MLTYWSSGKLAGAVCFLGSAGEIAEGGGPRGGCKPQCLDGEAGGRHSAPRAYFHQGSHGKPVWELVGPGCLTFHKAGEGGLPG